MPLDWCIVISIEAFHNIYVAFTFDCSCFYRKLGKFYNV